MDTNYKKVLIIYYDPDFTESIMERLKKFEIEAILATNLLEGEDILRKETFNLVVIECPVTIDIEILSKFLLQTDLHGSQVFLVAKEKRFMVGLDNQDNVSIFDKDEINNQISSFMEDINK